jgi:hypothetical protein
MNSSVKKVFNTISYLLNFIFIAIFLFAYLGSGDNIEDNINDDIEYIKNSIVERESAEIPLLTQKFENVLKIRIDSLVLTQGKMQPYSGYLVTVWDIDEKQDLSAQEWAANGYKDKYKRKEKVVYIEVDGIRSTKKDVSWRSDWLTAYRSIIKY